MRFVHWVRDNGDDAESAHDFDGLLVEYLQYIYEQGFGKSEGVNALYGILNRAPWLKEHLPMCTQGLDETAAICGMATCHMACVCCNRGEDDY